jgi:hypothetical protein
MAQKIHKLQKKIKNKTEINKLLKKRSKYIQIRIFCFSFSLTTRDRSFESAETLRKNAI